MKKIIALLISAGICGSAMAQVVGTVTNVQPSYSQVSRPVQECYQETVPTTGGVSGGAVLGGITGGLLGSTIGHGNGSIAAAAIGAGVGAIAGQNMSGNQGYHTENRCRYVQQLQTVTNGYIVTYSYNGMSGQFQSMRPYQVNEQIRLNLVHMQ